MTTFKQFRSAVSARKNTDFMMLLVASSCLLLHTEHAEAIEKPVASITKSNERKTGSTVKQQTLRNPSEETTAQRDRRLTRECKGRPNAGACLGYAQR